MGCERKVGKREFKITLVCIVKEHLFEWTSILKKYTSSLSHWVSVLSLNETQSDAERKYNLWKYWDMLFQNEQNEWGISKNLLALFFSNESEWVRHEQGSACIFSNESVEWIIKWLTQYSKFRNKYDVLKDLFWLS